MMFSFDDPNEFQKFAELHDKTRYCCFHSKIHGFYVLRPIKTSRNLDTAIYNGSESKDLDNFLKEQYDIIVVSEITFMKD